MNAPRCSPEDYITYQIASPDRYTCTEAARCQPEGTQAPAHDAFTRLLQRQPGDTAELWQEAQQLVPSQGGVLVVDDTTLDKPYAREIEQVTWHWSGKHHRVVRGINLVSLVWSDGTARIPCDFRVYDKPVGGKTKNEHFRDMVQAAHSRGLRPAYVLCDSWYSGLDNLKYLRQLGYAWLTRLKSNRQVNPDDSGNVAIRDLAIPPQGQQVHLRGYGFVRVFRTVADNGRAEYWASSDLDLTPDPPAGAGPPSLGHRGLPPRPEAVLRRGTGAGPRRPSPDRTHWLRHPRLSAPGVSPAAHRPELVRNPGCHRPHRRPPIYRKSVLYNSLNCVTPIQSSELLKPRGKSNAARRCWD